MRQTILMITVLALVGCGKKEAVGVADNVPTAPKVEVKTTAEEERPKKPLIANPIVEKAVRKSLKKPEGELAKADLEKVTKLELYDNQLTDVPKDLEELTQLKVLYLENNPTLTKAQIDELKKALPNCAIYHNAKK